MKLTRGSGKRVTKRIVAQIRASISFPPALYRSLEGVARQKKVSLAWVVRDAAEMYIAQAEKPEKEHIEAAGSPHAPATGSSSRRG
jgi:hypothetical protein